MDAVALAGTAFAALTPYLVKGGEELAKGAAKDLWELIKKPFVKDREKELLKKLETNPTDEGTRRDVVFKLGEFLEENPSLVKEFEEILQKLSHTVQKTNTQNVAGDDNVAMQDVSGSTINIHK